MGDDTTWIEQVTGGEVVRFDRTTAGRSRATWLVDVRLPDGSLRELVLRRDTGDGPLSGTELSLERESAVYGALEASAVPIPKLYGVAPDHLALLVERADGTESLSAAGGAEAQAAVLDSFIDAVAALHAVDVGLIDLPGFDRPASPEDHALVDLRLWRGVFDAHVRRPAPIVRFAFRWLEENPPHAVERTVLCHGDLGPGNFLHAAGAVTALLDWEFAHIGDPMDDLAWLSLRAWQVANLTDLGPLLARYVDRTGLKVDPDRVRYYQVMVLVRMAVACLVALDKRTGEMDASTYFALLPLLERQLATLLAEQLDVVLSTKDLPAPASASARSEILDTVIADLGNVYSPELQTVAARSRLMGTTLLLMHLKTADTLGAAIDAAELVDLGELLGSAPPDLEAGYRALEARIDAAPAAQERDVIAFFSRRADRQLALWPVVAPLAARPFPKVEAP